MIWDDDELISPFSGKSLRRDSPHSLTDGAERFPLIAEIPFLRAGREDLTRRTLEKLDAGDEPGALILLLQDQDDWARAAPPAAEDLQSLFDHKNLNLRQAMRILKYGAVADYFAYRWSDPTFLSGLKLLETHLPASAKTVFELACGIGHYLREFDLRNLEATGADVVFSKLWLARKFVAPNAKLVCFDANFDFPFKNKVFDHAFCHDAFYFLPQKARVAAELKRATRGALLIGHAHNANAANFSSGAAIAVADYAALFENANLYDDAELTAALIENCAPRAATVAELKETEAISLATNPAAGAANFDFQTTQKREKLRVNPLLIGENGEVCKTPRYPSERYRDEYAALSGYLNLTAAATKKLTARGTKNLSEAELADFARRRILLDLPEKW